MSDNSLLRIMGGEQPPPSLPSDSVLISIDDSNVTGIGTFVEHSAVPVQFAAKKTLPSREENRSAHSLSSDNGIQQLGGRLSLILDGENEDRTSDVISEDDLVLATETGRILPMEEERSRVPVNAREAILGSSLILFISIVVAFGLGVGLGVVTMHGNSSCNTTSNTGPQCQNFTTVIVDPSLGCDNCTACPACPVCHSCPVCPSYSLYPSPSPLPPTRYEIFCNDPIRCTCIPPYTGLDCHWNGTSCPTQEEMAKYAIGSRTAVLPYTNCSKCALPVPFQLPNNCSDNEEISLSETLELPVNISSILTGVNGTSIILLDDNTTLLTMSSDDEIDSISGLYSTGRGLFPIYMTGNFKSFTVPTLDVVANLPKKITKLSANVFALLILTPLTYGTYGGKSRGLRNIPVAYIYTLEGGSANLTGVVSFTDDSGTWLPVNNIVENGVIVLDTNLKIENVGIQCYNELLQLRIGSDGLFQPPFGPVFVWSISDKLFLPARNTNLLGMDESFVRYSNGTVSYWQQSQSNMYIYPVIFDPFALGSSIMNDTIKIYTNSTVFSYKL